MSTTPSSSPNDTSSHKNHQLMLVPFKAKRLSLYGFLLAVLVSGGCPATSAWLAPSFASTRFSAAASRHRALFQTRPSRATSRRNHVSTSRRRQSTSTLLASSPLDDPNSQEDSSSTRWNQELDAIVRGSDSSVLLSATTNGASAATAATPNRLRQAVNFLQKDQGGHNGDSRNVVVNGTAAATATFSSGVSSLSKSNWDALFMAIEEVTAEESYANENSILTGSANAASSTTENGGTGSGALFPLASTARTDMVDLYQVLADRGDLRLYGAVTTREPPAVVVSPSLPSRSLYQILSPAALESILTMPMSALTPRPTNSFLLAGGALALIEVLVSIATEIPFNAIVLTTILAATLDRLLLNGAVLESALQVTSPGIRDKIIRHEAGHLLLAYLLGCPVEGIVLSSWAALKDQRFGGSGRRHVSAGTSFFEPLLSSQINRSSMQRRQPLNGASAAGTTVGAPTVTRDSIDRYSIIVMAGIAAEADFYGQADGGAGDEMALVAFLQRLQGGGGSGSISRGAVSNWNDPEQIRIQARYGALQAVLLLRQYKAAHEAVIDALQRGGRLGDCIYAIERAARNHNLPTKATRTPVGYLAYKSAAGAAGGGGADWEWTTTPPPSYTAAATSITSSTDAATAAATTSTTTSTRPFDEAEARQTLQEYKLQVEQQLVTVQEQLQSLEQQRNDPRT